METKFCNKCNTLKNIEDFYKSRSFCIECCKEQWNIRKNTPEYKKWKEEYRDRTREEHNKKCNDRYHPLTEEEKNIKNKKHYQTQKAKFTPESIEKRRIQALEYEKRNKEKRRIQRAITRKKRYWADIQYRLEILLRTRLYKAIKRNKVRSAKELVGCTSEELRDHLISLWKPEMNWENFGRTWQVDHIIPIDAFDLSDPIQQEKCFHYTNLQPLFRTTEIANSFGYNEIGNQNKKNKILTLKPKK